MGKEIYDYVEFFTEAELAINLGEYPDGVDEVVSSIISEAMEILNKKRISLRDEEDIEELSAQLSNINASYLL